MAATMTAANEKHWTLIVQGMMMMMNAISMTMWKQFEKKMTTIIMKTMKMTLMTTVTTEEV